MNKTPLCPKYLIRTIFNKVLSIILLESFLISQFPVYIHAESSATIPEPVINQVVEVYEQTVTSDSDSTIEFGKIRLDIPSGAIKEETKIVIEKLAYVEELDEGMLNVTGEAAGYRFKPDGMKFEKHIFVTLPFSKQRLRNDDEAINIYTYFYNIKTELWERLERVSIDKENGTITSKTNHFTDLINSTLKLPESPKPLSFNPNSIKDIKAADPGSGINLIAPPEANNQGSASLSYPIEVPPGRMGMMPQVQVQYNSDGGNDWMGVGWNISYQTIGIDTRWGVPQYDPKIETETYVLAGRQLTPVAHRGELINRNKDNPEKVFHMRIEGSFSKIIRHGTTPINYWWEVIDKNGTKSFFGGTPENGVDWNAVLSKQEGSEIFKWALKQMRDTNGNTVNYTYKRKLDTGIGNGTGADDVPGIQLYLKRINYTGSIETPGKYSISFIRDEELPNEPRRPDVSIDGRAGFKVVTADLLRKIEVKFDNQPIRSYEFIYTEGAFKKTLLTNIVQYGQNEEEFNRHTFEYYDEVRENGKYNGFYERESYDIGNDNVGVDEILGYGGASAIGSSSSITGGGHLYLGINPNITTPTKAGSTGFKTGYSHSTSVGILCMLDLNGDGLPDKVFKKNGQYFYRPNLTQPQGSISFGSPINLNTLMGISTDSSDTVSVGVETYQAVNGMANESFTFTTGSVYFSDVNADGLPDLVKNGQVWYNHLENDLRVPTFTLSSDDTPVPIPNANIDSEGLVADYTEQYNTQIDNFPLIDAIKRWEAPYNGQITIQAPVKLVTIPPESYETADGVRVAIQINGNEIWHDTIDENDLSPHFPTGLNSLNVNKGDRIYFRVQSVFDGAYDYVEWDPVITYLNVPTKEDVNGLNYSGCRFLGSLDPSLVPYISVPIPYFL